jgi:hypothetical protein
MIITLMINNSKNISIKIINNPSKYISNKMANKNYSNSKIY